MSKCACDVATTAACCATGCLCHCLNARPSLFRSTLPPPARARPQSVTEEIAFWSGNSACCRCCTQSCSRRRCSLGAMILRGQTVVVVTVSLVAVDFLFWTPVSERASSSASVHPRSDYCIALRFCLLSLSPRSPQSSAAYQLVHDYCNRAVKDQLDGRPRLKTQTIFSSF